MVRNLEKLECLKEVVSHFKQSLPSVLWADFKLWCAEEVVGCYCYEDCEERDE